MKKLSKVKFGTQKREAGSSKVFLTWNEDYIFNPKRFLNLIDIWI